MHIKYMLTLNKVFLTTNQYIFGFPGGSSAKYFLRASQQQQIHLDTCLFTERTYQKRLDYFHMTSQIRSLLAEDLFTYTVYVKLLLIVCLRKSYFLHISRFLYFNLLFIYFCNLCIIKQMEFLCRTASPHRLSYVISCVLVVLRIQIEDRVFPHPYTTCTSQVTDSCLLNCVVCDSLNVEEAACLSLLPRAKIITELY